MGKFIKLGDIEHEQFEWGDVGWRCVPRTGAKELVVMASRSSRVAATTSTATLVRRR